MKRTRGRQPGIALVLVLMLVVVASVLGMSYLSVTTVSLTGSANLVRAGRARYLAESGLQHALYLLRTDSPLLAGHDEGNPLGPYYADSSDDSYVFYTEPLEPLTYRVTARATSRGLTRTSRLTVRLFSTYRNDVESYGPMAYWRMGELAGPLAEDSAGGFDGTYRNGVVLGQPGAIGGDLDPAARFDGQNDYVDLGTMDLGGGLLTIIAWFKADAFLIPDMRIVSKADALDSNRHYWMISTVDVGEGVERLRFRLKAGGVTSTLVAEAGDLEPGKWVMVAATYDGTWMRLYKDGENVGQMIKFGLINDDDDVLVWMGNSPPVDTSRPFDGLIDEVAIYRRCASEKEIRSLYKARVASARILSWDI
jgi:hypothetical protein